MNTENKFTAKGTWDAVASPVPESIRPFEMDTATQVQMKLAIDMRKYIDKQLLNCFIDTTTDVDNLVLSKLRINGKTKTSS